MPTATSRPVPPSPRPPPARATATARTRSGPALPEPLSPRAWASLAAGILAWELAARAGVLPALLLPPPTRVLASFVEALTSGALARQAPPTVLRFTCGFALGAALGAACGASCGLSRSADAALSPWIDATFALPKVALLPCLMAVLGAGEPLALCLVALAVFYPVAIAARRGAREADPALLEAAANLGADRGQILRAVIAPSLTPYLLVGAHLGVLTALAAAVVAEMLLSLQGLGRVIWISGEWLRMDACYAYIAVLAGLGMAASAALRAAGRRLAPWTEP